MHGAHVWLYLESGTTFGSVSNWFQISLGTRKNKLPRVVNKVNPLNFEKPRFSKHLLFLSFSPQIFIYTAYFIIPKIAFRPKPRLLRFNNPHRNVHCAVDQVISNKPGWD